MRHNLARIATLTLLSAALSLSACNGASGASSAAGTVEQVNAAGMAEVPLTITQGDQVHRFTVEVAATTQQQSRGMMFRTALAPDRGMIFPFPQPRIASFWMRNTLIPLDMIFVRADGTIDRIAENTVPHDESPVASGGDVQAVLELAGGTAARLGIDESAVVRWQMAAPAPR